MTCPDGGIGRRASFRCWCPYGRGGSSPLLAPDFHLIKTENSLIALGYWRLKICFTQQNAGGGIPDSASRATGFGINPDDPAFFA